MFAEKKFVLSLEDSTHKTCWFGRLIHIGLCYTFLIGFGSVVTEEDFSSPSGQSLHPGSGLLLDRSKIGAGSGGTACQAKTLWFMIKTLGFDEARSPGQLEFSLELFEGWPPHDGLGSGLRADLIRVAIWAGTRNGRGQLGTLSFVTNLVSISFSCKNLFACRKDNCIS